MIDFVRADGLDFVIFSNPSAVTGRRWSTEEISTLLSACPDTLFVIDEADSIYPHQSGSPLVNTYANALFLHSFSKFYGLSGLRIGYLVTPRAYAHHLARTISPAELASIAIVAARAALGDTDYQHTTQRTVERNLDTLTHAVRSTSIRLAPHTSCFAAYLTARDETLDLPRELAHLGVDIVPGSAFGLTHGGRINLSNPALIDRLVEVLPAFPEHPEHPEGPASKMQR
ncbi:aminotransferase class I/II-fold pyridoxal phosphate-dependent enzyme [Streptomyces sp. CA-132043]|uniref:aminotransferase class I/II-fold pyridoxal phosphate-dependent enzyme n=1 Tax=Streptomyces sp. CA-132043 TaxID=3240048 RepID=UPI003D91C673